MAADNVDPIKVESMLRRMAEQVAPTSLPTTKVDPAAPC
jgi:hypothetical protein